MVVLAVAIHRTLDQHGHKSKKQLGSEYWNQQSKDAERGSPKPPSMTGSRSKWIREPALTQLPW